MQLLDLSAYAGLVPTIAEQLRAAIATGDIRPGQRLIQEDFARAMGVSREPVRQAFALLQAEGLVVQRPRRGVIVVPLTADLVRDIYDVRIGLDGIAARRAAERGMPDWAAAKARTLAKQARRHLHGHDVGKLVADDRAFHQLVLEASGNTIAREILDALWNRIALVVRAVLQSGYAEKAWHEHDAILEAIVSRDAERAGMLARAHAQAASEMLVSHLLESELREATGP
jgi:DNA-binding GntR family transcriptional regulator